MKRVEELDLPELLTPGHRAGPARIQGWGCTGYLLNSPTNWATPIERLKFFNNTAVN